MPTLLANLITRRNAIGVELAALSATTAGGLPDSSKSGIGHVAYKDGLYRELEFLTEQITALGGDDADGGAVFEQASIIE